MSPFIVYALPRSRTAWLSRFLSFGEYVCEHEQARHLRTVNDLRMWLSQDCVGASETSAAPHWRLVQALRPDIKVLVVRRPVSEVIDSLMALNLGGVCQFDRATLVRDMARLNTRLDQIEHRVSGALSVRFHDLVHEETCARVFEHCLPYRHDPTWWAIWAPGNVQANVGALLRYHAAHKPAMDRLAAEAKHKTISLIRARRPVADADDGVSFHEESFETLWRDGQALFAEHAAEVGPRDGVTLNLNVPLIRRLEEIGALHLMTARCNGRLFGYLASVVSPSLENASLLVATQTVFFVSSDFRGLGARLQRESIDRLKARGVREVIMRAGVRGSGSKLGALYRRLGAIDHGHLYSLTMKAA